MRGTTTLLGKGSRCAPPLHPPGLWLFHGIEPVQEPVERIPVQSVAGDFALPAPIDQRAIAPLEATRNLWPLHHQSGERSCYPQYPHDHFMETRNEAFHSCPCLGTIPSTTEPSRPIGTLTNLPQIGYRHRIGAEPDQIKSPVPAILARSSNVDNCPLGLFGDARTRCA